MNTAALLGMLLGSLLDPVSFGIALVVVLFSKKLFIIPIAAAVATVLGETLADSMQAARVWGGGLQLPIHFLAGLVHASIVFRIRSRRRARKVSR